MTTAMEFDVEIPAVVDSDGEGKIACDVCGKMVSSRGMTRHVNAAHPDNASAKPQRRLAGKRGKKVKGLSAEVSEGLASVAGKFLFLMTLIMAWSALRRANIPDPSGETAEHLAMTDDEATAIGRVLARIFASTAPGRRIAPAIVENEDLIDATFAGWEWYKRQRDFFDQLNPQQVQEPATAMRERSIHHGSNGQVATDRSEGEGAGVPYIGPSVQDILGA